MLAPNACIVIKTAFSSWAWTNLTAKQGALCHCPFLRLLIAPSLWVAASDERIAAAPIPVVALAAAQMPRPDVFADPLLRDQGMLCSSCVIVDVPDRTVVDATTSDCSGLWVARGSSDRSTHTRSGALVPIRVLRELRQIPHTAHGHGRAESLALVKQAPDLAVAKRAPDLAGTAPKRTVGPIQRPLETRCLRLSRQTLWAPWVGVCRLARKPSGCRVPTSSAPAVELLAWSSPLPAFASPPPWPPAGRLS